VNGSAVLAQSGYLEAQIGPTCPLKVVPAYALISRSDNVVYVCLASNNFHSIPLPLFRNLRMLNPFIQKLNIFIQESFYVRI
jgi:hypothetical protein